MAAKNYAVTNGAAPGANPAAAISTGTATKTMIQLATNTTTPAIRFTEWWAEFDGSTAATPIKVELMRHTTAPQTTLTAYVAADIARFNDPNAPASGVQRGSMRKCVTLVVVMTRAPAATAKANIPATRLEGRATGVTSTARAAWNARAITGPMRKSTPSAKKA